VLTPVYSFILTCVGSFVTYTRVSLLYEADACVDVGYDLPGGAGAGARAA
jgi:hypothetical protein